MAIVRSTAVGAGAALIGSLLADVVVTFTVGYGVHPLEATPWLFMVSVVPAMVVAWVVDIVGRRTAHTSTRMWLVATVAAFSAVVLAASIGAVSLQSLRFGFNRVNWIGYLKWSPVYGMVALPLTAPICYGATRLLWTRNR